MDNDTAFYRSSGGGLIYYLISEGPGYWHRLDGPAYIYDEEEKTYMREAYGWWIYDNKIDNRKISAWMKEQGFTEDDFGTEAFALAVKLRWA